MPGGLRGRSQEGETISRLCADAYAAGFARGRGEGYRAGYLAGFDEGRYRAARTRTGSDRPPDHESAGRRDTKMIPESDTKRPDSAAHAADAAPARAAEEA